MEKILLSLFMIVLFVGMVSASYSCSSGILEEDVGVVNIREIETVGGIRIAVLDSSGGVASAEIMAGARNVRLTNQSPSKTKEFIGDDYDIELLNLTGDSAWISIEDKDGEVEEMKVTQIKGLQVYGLRFEGQYPESDATVDLVIGEVYLFLHEQNSKSIETISGEEYLIEVSSSTSQGALVNVLSCPNGSLVEVEDPVEPIEPVQNVSNNVSYQINVSQEPEPGENTTNIGSTDKDDVEKKSFFDPSNRNFFYISVTVSIVLVIIIIFLYVKGSSSSSTKDSSEDEEDEVVEV